MEMGISRHGSSFRIAKNTKKKTKDTIWVIGDRLNKSAHFIPICKVYSMDKFVELYVDGILRLHGVPVSIVSNRKLRFISIF